MHCEYAQRNEPVTFDGNAPLIVGTTMPLSTVSSWTAMRGWRRSTLGCELKTTVPSMKADPRTVSRGTVRPGTCVSESTEPTATVKLP